MSDLSKLRVVIPTRDRLESLRLTLLALGQGTPAPFDVHIVDNGPVPQIARRDLPATPYPVLLSHVATPGKGQAVRRALADLPTDDVLIVAVLDDDMTPSPGWASDVIQSCDKRPAFAVFAGRSHVIWPEDTDIPDWAHVPLIQGVGLSVIDLGPEGDHEMGDGVVGYPSGNHYWFRAGILSDSPPFPVEGWTPDMEFVVAARRAGHRGVFVPEVEAGHRVQPHLLELETLFDRAQGFGHALARAEQQSQRDSALINRVRSALRRLKWRRRAKRLEGSRRLDSRPPAGVHDVVEEVTRRLELGKARARSAAQVAN